MDKYSRNQRITGITKILIENPNKVINLNTFTELFNAAKSTISEDILIVRETLSRLNMGKIETIQGASGGIKYIYGISEEKSKKFALDLCNILEKKDRIISGDFIYITDIMCSPEIISEAAIILASYFNTLDINYVVTVETKGIPLAYEVSKALGVELAIVRRNGRISEGTTVSINYVSGSSKRIQTMSLSKKAMCQGSKCIFIDDFMKGGGTAYGITELLNEFNCTLLGIGVLIDNVQSQNKLVNDYISIVDLIGVEENGVAKLVPSKQLK